MNLKELQNNIRSLALLKGTDAVVMSCYLNLQDGGVANRDFFHKRINLLRKTLAKAQLLGFEDAVVRICDYYEMRRGQRCL